MLRIDLYYIDRYFISLKENEIVELNIIMAVNGHKKIKRRDNYVNA
jgi:hypothetical protein